MQKILTLASAAVIAIALAFPAAAEKMANPCAPMANPCAPAKAKMMKKDKKANPCAANPCAAKPANPCAKNPANPCAKK